MQRSTVVVLGLAGLIGCASSDSKPDESVDYESATAAAVGDDILVAMTRREAWMPDQIEIARVQLGEPVSLSPALVGSDASPTLGTTHLAAIDGQAYLTFYSDTGDHGAPLTQSDTIEPGTIVDLGHDPALTRAGARFAAVSFPEQAPFSIFLPVGTFHATFVRPDGQQDGDLDVATEASPVGEAPRSAGNAKVFAMLFRRATWSGADLFVARLSDAGALLDPDGIQVAADGGDQVAAGDAQLAVTADGGVLVVYDRLDGSQSSIHAMRIEPGAAPAISDQVTDLVTTPSFLVTSGDQILAVSVPGVVPSDLPTFERFETRILDDHGRTLSGPVTVATGDRTADVIATSTGFAVIHSGSTPHIQLTVIGRDGSPGDSVTLATSHQPVPDIDPGGCSAGRGPGGRCTLALVLVLVVGWGTARRRRVPRRTTLSRSSG
jgi:hypothetical protein